MLGLNNKPGLYFPKEKRNVVTVWDGGRSSHDHSPHPMMDEDYVVQCEDDRCRAELLRIGGVELKRGEKFYYAEGTVVITVGNAIAGRSHVHEINPQTGEVSCEGGAPGCIAHFELDFRLGLCSRKPEERPLSVTERERRAAALDEDAKRQAAVELEVMKARRWDPFKAQQGLIR